MACVLWYGLCAAKQALGDDMGIFMCMHEPFHVATGYQGGKHKFNVSFELMGLHG
jgi:hypothetical protein